jgi:lipopolysaccharide transport system ATP-binding protein
VASLLEVGTGFDRDLTGRENIYLSGAILGMRKAEIDARFEEIVAFSEVERFIDTPVKHYSSGMYVRLAFSVAAHLQSEILIVDEVLAVGDDRFQKKCLAKMSDFGSSGHTVLFVSHNMSAISRLCSRAVLLRDGRLAQEGPTDRVVAAYLDSGANPSGAVEWPTPHNAPKGHFTRLRAVRVRTADGPVGETVDIRETISLEMEYEVLVEGKVFLAAFDLTNGNHVRVCNMIDLDPEWRRKPRPIGRYTSVVSIPGNFLAEGLHWVDVSLALLHTGELEFHESQIVSFRVVEGVNVGEARGDYRFEMRGVVRPVFPWTTRFSPLSPPEHS